jgi:hypothetical protein
MLTPGHSPAVSAFPQRRACRSARGVAACKRVNPVKELMYPSENGRMGNPRCCGHEMRGIAIGNPGPRGLLLYVCDACRRHDWQRDGVSVTVAQALEVAQALDAFEASLR